MDSDSDSSDKESFPKGSSASRPQARRREAPPEIKKMSLPTDKGKGREMPARSSANHRSAFPDSSQLTLVNPSQRQASQRPASLIPPDHPFAQSDGEGDYRTYSLPSRPRPRLSQFTAPSTHKRATPASSHPDIGDRSDAEPAQVPKEEDDDVVILDGPPQMSQQPRKRRRADLQGAALNVDVARNDGPPARNTRGQMRAVEPAASRQNGGEGRSSGEEHAEMEPVIKVEDLAPAVIPVEGVRETYQEEEYIQQILQGSDLSEGESDQGTDDERTEAQLFRNSPDVSVPRPLTRSRAVGVPAPATGHRPTTRLTVRELDLVEEIRKSMSQRRR